MLGNLISTEYSLSRVTAMKISTRRKSLFYTLLLLLIIVWPASHFAAKESLKLKADYSYYSENQQILTASQNVHIIYKDVEIFAPYITLDTIGNILTSTGKIKIKRGEDQFDSSYLMFDMNKNIITIKGIA